MRLSALVAVFLLFLLSPVIAFAVLVFVTEGRVVGLLHGGFQRLALGGFTLALPAALVPGAEQLIEPRQHLLDRRQWAGRPGLAARALRPRRPLRSDRSRCTGRPARSGFALLALRTGLAQRSGLPDRSRLALRSWLAARAIRPAFAWMTLRSRPPRFALPSARALRSLPFLFVCHAAAPLTGSKLISGV